eukprot:TRINITY_DN3157_c4_g1_i4.p1 TRINITY_DN3157_c4_g1~~TRINITY_DN3157_c4_g1_i4.p1  ORF type:complete len:555 (+),score=87.36 TRINITY_DN3157_c4_g1_i4:543-2207(+)
MQKPNNKVELLIMILSTMIIGIDIYFHISPYSTFFESLNREKGENKSKIDSLRFKTKIDNIKDLNNIPTDILLKKEKFLVKYPDYGYNNTIDKLRTEQFPHLKNETYLDYTGSGTYQKRQIERFSSDLSEHLYGNSHSHSSPSLRTDYVVSHTRKQIMEFFNSNFDENHVIFTSGATAGLQTIGRSFKWSNKSSYVYTRHNHNSVIGIRYVAKEHGVKYRALHELEIDDILIGKKPKLNTSADANHLFAFPAECNFSGIKYPLEWIELIKRGGLGPGTWYVILDAAAFLPTNRLDLSKYKPDFVVLSFYKLFGFPTGIGCLIVNAEAEYALHKTFVGGGTIVMQSCDSDFCVWRDQLHEKFEDGTLNFLDILGVKYGLEVINDLGMDNINMHVWSLTEYAYDQLSSLRHKNGKKVMEFYGKHHLHDSSKQGGILSFNFKRPDGSYLFYTEADQNFGSVDIHVRTGAHCNPGACFDSLNLDMCKLEDVFVKKTHCGDEIDSIEGVPLGAVRVSIGYPSTFEDIDTLIEFIKKHFVDAQGTVQPSNEYSSFFDSFE